MPCQSVFLDKVPRTEQVPGTHPPTKQAVSHSHRSPSSLTVLQVVHTGMGRLQDGFTGMGQRPSPPRSRLVQPHMDIVSGCGQPPTSYWLPPRPTLLPPLLQVWIKPSLLTSQLLLDPQLPPAVSLLRDHLRSWGEDSPLSQDHTLSPAQPGSWAPEQPPPEEAGAQVFVPLVNFCHLTRAVPCAGNPHFLWDKPLGHFLPSSHPCMTCLPTSLLLSGHLPLPARVLPSQLPPLLPLPLPPSLVLLLPVPLPALVLPLLLFHSGMLPYGQTACAWEET